MKKKIFIIAIVASLLGYYSCQKEENVITPEIQSVENYNKNIVESYRVELDHLSCLKSMGVTEFLNTDEGKELFVEYFINFKIRIEEDGVTSINNYNPSLVNDLYDATIVKLINFEGSNLKSLNTAPTDEEIRDALLKECGTYTEPIGEICKGAVWIAYWLR